MKDKIGSGIFSTPFDKTLDTEGSSATVAAITAMNAGLENFNPVRLTLAREAVGLTQSALARKVAISQSKISKIEDATLAPTDQDVKEFATALSRPIEFFSKPGKPLASAVSFYRKTNSLSITAFKQCNARMNIRRLDYQERLAEAAAVLHTNLPHFPVADVRSPSSAAKELRRYWKVQRGPIPNLTALAENSSCVVIHFDFGTKKLDGLSLWSEGELPFVFLNGDFPAARMRLTLAHELGHLVMHRAPSATVEDEAWEFASELLMPEAELRNRFYPATIETLATLKLEWGVSMQALLKRGENLGRISPRYARFLWMQMSKCGYRIQEPYDDQIPREEPRTKKNQGGTIDDVIVKKI